MTPSLAPAVSTGASETPAAKRHRAVFTNLLLARSLTASPSQRTKSSDFQGISMGGTGLEPVTPSLSSPQDATPTFAPARAYRCLCRSFRSSQHCAFVRVGDLLRLLVLAPVSTGRRWCGLPRTSERRRHRTHRTPHGSCSESSPSWTCRLLPSRSLSASERP